MKLNRYTPFLIFGFVLFLFLFFSTAAPGFKWDAVQYLREARALASAQRPLALWVPLISFVEAGLFLLLGEEAGIFVTKLYVALLSSLLAIFLYFISYKLARDEEKSLLAMFGVFSFPFFYWATKLYIDPMACTFLLMGIYFYAFADQTKRTVLSGIFFALSALSKLFYIAFIIPVLLLFGNLKRKTLSFLSCAVFILPWFLFSFFEYGNALHIVNETLFTYAHFSHKESAFEAFGKVLLHTFSVFPLFAFLLAGKKDRVGVLLLSWLLIYLLLPGGKDIRYVIPFLVLILPYTAQSEKRIFFPCGIVFLTINACLLAGAFGTDFLCSGEAFAQAGEALKGINQEVCADDFWPLLSWYSGKDVKACISVEEQKNHITRVNPEKERLKKCEVIKEFRDRCFFVYLARC